MLDPIATQQFIYMYGFLTNLHVPQKQATLAAAYDTLLVTHVPNVARSRSARIRLQMAPMMTELKSRMTGPMACGRKASVSREFERLSIVSAIRKQ